MLLQYSPQGPQRTLKSKEHVSSSAPSIEQQLSQLTAPATSVQGQTVEVQGKGAWCGRGTCCRVWLLCTSNGRPGLQMAHKGSCSYAAVWV